MVTVLQSQGVTDPSEEILEKAIQEYYAKNPQGVSFIFISDLMSEFVFYFVENLFSVSSFT